ncbi:uncharacterized protein BP5553_03552 [Venustampulla echinocandica]|uniref:SET domain-containing protein n=1 Tax=Venustampulla echinocandica TaxID=2656787 RepID=A0A370TUJ5_9HELO|nr:uncharacterized protein BP5553_03552 [Venustampulla echinocandica]RDL39212.1 hypothetical protein BP5553_03552 [Venustampulla echinocandica]
MHRDQLPIAALTPWSKLNDVAFIDSSVQELGESRGFGLLTNRALSSKNSYDIPTLLDVSHDLILSAEAIEEHVKVDQHFRELMEVAGGKSLRSDILLFLLMQITIASNQGVNVGVQNPWTEYCRILPGYVPVPTLWSDEERILLVGTSLEPALSAKMSALARELDELRERTTNIAWCQKYWWEHDALSITEWALLDAWYRSRSLELPNAGESMVPCLDMANHSSEPNSYYEQGSSNNVLLLLRPDVTLDDSSEITISYGDAKSEAEMLFSYGFIDESSVKARGLVLPLDTFPEDPLGKAKVSAFIGQPKIHISADQDNIQWDSPFLYLMCLNEEDGLQFKVLQQTDGSRSSLRVFWQGSDVTDVTDTFETLINIHEFQDVFKLRVVSSLQSRIGQQLERLAEGDEMVQSLASMVQITPDVQRHALQLRASEKSILQKAYATVDMQKTSLLESKVVLRYLGVASDEDKPEQAETNNEEEDFS